MMSTALYAGILKTRDPFWSDVVFQMTGNSGQIREESRDLPITVIGNPTINENGFIVLTADSIKIDNILPLNRSNFTVEVILRRFGGDSSHGGAITTLSTATNGVAIATDIAWHGTSSAYGKISTGVPLASSSIHLAYVRDGKTIRLFKNGEFLKSVQQNSVINITSTTAALGRRYVNKNQYLMSCEIKARITKSVRYAASFSPPNDFRVG